MSHLKSDKMKRRSGCSGSSRTGNSVWEVMLIVIVCVVLASAVIGFTKSPSRRQCKEIVQQFQTACNGMNINEILSCLNPAIANPLKAAITIGGAVTSTDTDEVLADILSALGGGTEAITRGSGLDMTSAFRAMELKVTSCGLPSKARKVQCKATFGIFEQYLNIYVSKKFGEPYISKIRFASK